MDKTTKQVTKDFQGQERGKKTNKKYMKSLDMSLNKLIYNSTLST